MATNGQKKNNTTANEAPGADLSSRWGKWFALIALAFAIMMGVRALSMTSDFNALSYRLASSGWGKFATVIMQNKISALWHGAFMTICAAAFIWLLYGNIIRKEHLRRVAQWILVAIVAADAFLLSCHYIKTMPLKAFEENEVIRILKTALPEKRAVLLTQEGFYNNWLTYLLPYHGIKTMNVTQMPRMATDYKKFFTAIGRDQVRLWQMSAVGFALGPAQFWRQFQGDPAMKDVFEIIYAYNVKPADSYVEVVPATEGQPGQHVVMRFLKPAPRVVLIGGWEVVGDDEALRRIASKDYRVFEKVMLAPESAARVNLPASGGSNECGQAQALSFRSGRMRIRTSSTAPAVLRVADRYDPDWKAWIDGKRAEVMRTDFIFLGVFVEPGMHEVIIQYAPAKWPVAVQAVGLLLFASAAGMLLFKRKAGIKNAG